MTDAFFCPYLRGEVQLSRAREAHIAERHPDFLPDYRDRIGTTLADPDQVRRSRRFGAAKLFSRWYSDVRDGKYVVVVVASAGDDGRHWIITAYIACRRRDRMGAKLSFKYDRDANILHIDKRPPYPEQESEELGDEVIVRLNPNTRWKTPKSCFSPRGF